MSASYTKKNVDVFDKDVVNNEGYLYTHSENLSTRLSNERMTKGIADIVNLNNKTVLDLGCGDGTFSLKLADMGAEQILGIDPAEHAIQSAKNKIHDKGYKNITFKVGNIYEMDYHEKQFDVVVLRGVLHHLPDPKKAVALAIKWGREVVILEPNGMNLALKLIEKISSYHREHEEQSFLKATLTKWVKNSGGKVVQHHYINLVPIFSPALVARLLKKLESVVERIPLIRSLVCGQYVLRVTK